MLLEGIFWTFEQILMNMQWYSTCSCRHNVTGFVAVFCLSVLFVLCPMDISRGWSLLLGHTVLLIFSSNGIFCPWMWPGQGRAFCGRFQDMLSSQPWCWTVLQGKFCIPGAMLDWSVALHEGRVDTSGGGGLLCWYGRCRHISPVTPGDNGFLVKLSSTSALPYRKAPPFQVQWSIFYFFTDTGPICQCSLRWVMACTWILFGIVDFLIKVKDCSW